MVHRHKAFSLVIAIVASFAFCIGSKEDVRAQALQALPDWDPMTWLIKSVCVDAQNHLTTADPYNCPPGMSIRKIRIGEPLPYHNLDQGGYQQKDSYPVYDLNRNTLVVSPFDFPPFNKFNLGNGSDGYDIYAVQNGWATAPNTSDGGGYGTTFFGANCTVGDGWNFFPARGFKNGGTTSSPIAGVYWEQSGQSFPGACPIRYSTDSLTSWRFQPGFVFGGVNGSPTKIMDTMISVHGFQPGPVFLQRGHLEVFYFTKEYGVTRWEVWRPLEQNPTKTTQCNCPAIVSYQGVNFVVTSARDWSKVVPASKPEIPVWPIPNLNLLQHAHFDNDFANSWARGGTSLEGNVINWSRRNSIAPRDKAYSPKGVSYLATNCGGTCRPAEEKIYQDIPVTKFVSGQTYAYGVCARTEPGQGKGTLQITIHQIGANNNVLWSHTVEGEVASDNGTPPTPAGEAESVHLSSAFVYKTVKINLNPNTVKIRFFFTPLTPQTFDILEAWFAPWPVPGLE